MKKIILATALFITGFSFAQENNSEEKSTYIKANALFLPIGVLNAGIETQLSEKYTLQGDIFISPWKSFTGKYAQIYMMGFEGRYYFNQAFKHWYVGANISAATYKLQKWNYWKDGNFQLEEGSPIYNKSDLYQEGFTFMIGATVGYQFQLSENWNMDLYIGGGSSQDFYEGYHKTLGVRYDKPEGDNRRNRSGEFIPYRGGVMISYKLK